MKKELRNTGIDGIGRVPWGTHFCQFYHAEGDLMDILVPYFKKGLEDNELCIWVTSKPLYGREAGEMMRKAVQGFDGYLKKGQMEIVPYTDIYVKDGAFNPRIHALWIEKLNLALSKGYDGIRITGDAGWIKKEEWKKLACYEEEFDGYIGKHRIIALCSYPADSCGVSEVMDVARTHQFALIKREENWETTQLTENKSCRETLQSCRDQLRSMVSDMFLAEEKERRRLASHLHDHVAQMLALSISKLKAVRESLSSTVYAGPLDEISEMARQTLDNIRSLTFDLSPPDLYELGLVAALEGLCEQFQKKHEVIVCFEGNRGIGFLDNEISVLLFRTVNELLFNAVKHAKAYTVRVSVEKDGHTIRINVSDDGIGFEPSAVDRNRNTGFGLFSIRERLKHIRGRLDIKSRPGFGTRISIITPAAFKEESCLA